MQIITKYKMHLDVSAHIQITLRKKLTMYQLTTTLTTSKSVLFLGYSHLLTTSTDDPSLQLSPLLVLGQ